jgi:hypothetical protein
LLLSAILFSSAKATNRRETYHAKKLWLKIFHGLPFGLPFHHQGAGNGFACGTA